MKKLRRISLILTYGGLVYLLILFIGFAKFSNNEKLLPILISIGFALFFIVEITAMIISLIFWRCQYCSKGFPIQIGSMDKAKICPFCGHPLE